MSYSKFLKDKRLQFVATGIETIPPLHNELFDFQRDIVAWALRRGRAAIFADCGLGKTFMQLEWARHIPGDVLILAPLAVAAQTAREGKAFGIPVTVCRTQSDVKPGINIANYEMLDHFDATKFAGVVLDESSILKAYDGATRTAIIEAFQRVPFRLACTATPSPNDYMELGNHSEFLGVMTRAEMLAMFFVHDGGDTAKWRLKGHAQDDFWRWVCSWAVNVRKPSDLGYSDGKFKLPPLQLHEVMVRASKVAEGNLFAMPAATLQERIAERRNTINDRCGVVINFLHEKIRKMETMVRKEQGTAQKETPGMVSQEQASYRQGKEKRVHEKIFSKQPREVGAHKGSTGTSKSSKEGSVRGGCGLPERMPPDVEKLAHQEPGEKKGAEIEEVRHHARTNGRDDGGPGAGVRNLLGKGEAHKILPDDRPLPFDGESSRGSLRGLQFRDREIQGRPLADSTGASISNAHTGKYLVWCNLNAEQDMIAKALGNLCVSIQGSTPNDKKLELEAKWREGDVPVLVTKSLCFGYGMNWQHCNEMFFVGLSDSYEQIYQSIRRCYRFGQPKPVNVYMVVADTEGAVLQNIKRKELDAAAMAEEMVKHMKDLNKESLKGATKRTATEYYPKTKMHLPGWMA